MPTPDTRPTARPTPPRSSRGRRRLRAAAALVTATCALVLAAPAAAAPELGPVETLYNVPGPWGLDAADMNGDGRLDVVTVGYADDQVRVALQQEDGSFGTPSVVGSASAFSNGLEVGELDGDGRPDIAVHSTDGMIHPLRQNADGTFTDAPFAPPQTLFRSLGIGDANDDGRNDIVVATPGSLWIMLQQANGTFVAEPALSVGSQVETIDFGDVDGDGTTEIALADFTASRVHVVGRQGGSFAIEHTYNLPNWPWSVAVGDLDGDGRDEIVASQTGGLVILEHEGGAYTIRPGSLPVDSGTFIRLADFDGDGRLDIFAVGDSWANPTRAQILHQQADGTFTVTHQPFGTTLQPWAVAIGDIDGDGNPDALIASADDDRVALLHNRRDTTDPVITVTTPVQDATYARGATVNADFACSDGARGSGIDSCTGTVADGQPIDTATLGTKTFKVTAEDEAGNTAEKTVTYTVVDDIDPTITITTPVDNATYARGATVNADYACADETGGSGIDSCTGTVADGQPIDTATLGTKTFKVTAEDEAGNTAEKTVTYTVVDETDPSIDIDSPTDDAPYARGATVLADFLCADDEGGSGLTSCVGTVADGQPIDTATLGTKTFKVTAEDEAGNTAERTVEYTVTDQTDPTIELTTPVDGATYVRGATVSADYACADEAAGSGIAACTGTVPNGEPIDTGSAGAKTFTVTAKDAAGNSASKTVSYTVSEPATDPTPDPQPPVPGPREDAAPPAPEPVPSCRTPFVTIVDLRPSGSVAKPRTTLLAVASTSLAGRTVAVRRDGRQVGTGRIGADGRISVTVPAPAGAKARARARYRLVVGDVRSLSLKAARQATISQRKTLSGGRLQVTGRILGVRRATTITVESTPVCGDGRARKTRIRTDRRGGFRVTLAAPSGTTTALTYRVRYANRTVTLPVLLTVPGRTR
ncbi:FG-GAP-like repeat-containing protein [Patulibacter brassicae]|uniref:FG-GAP-like repeat-containing protein n=1 Tax=Patulibacter brassicae TaxID=1705717 RepID=A0ABU4VKB9_9ACTN|nr:FG-GAP-like repeat-containing protein [Patulibacter brassicae]MDX8152277.1 FG-GAP-like repeat-containing protein [Patulibacter brassicae]